MSASSASIHSRVSSGSMSGSWGSPTALGIAGSIRNSLPSYNHSRRSARTSPVKNSMIRNRFAPLIAALLAGCGAMPSSEAPLDAIKTVVVIYAENHSFDNMYGMFPGANGVASATALQTTQLDHDGRPLAHLRLYSRC